MRTEREQIINALLRCAAGECDQRCSYNELRYGCRPKLMRDALELLKEQEAVKPILKREGRNKYYNYYVCPVCDNELWYDQNYCIECGRAVDWGE